MLGGGAVAARVLLDSLSPSRLSTLALGLGAVLMWIVVLLRGRRVLAPSVRQWAWLLLLAIPGTALPLVAILLGLTRTSAAVGGFLIQLQGIAALLFAALFLRERLNRWQLVGVLVMTSGTTGVAILAVGASEGLAGDGAALVVGGAVGLGFGFLPARLLAQEMDALWLTTLRLTIATVLLAVLSGLPDSSWFRVASFGFWVLLISYAVTNFCLSYVAIHASLTDLGAGETGLILQLMPAFAAIVGVVLLREAFTSTQVVAGVVSLGGGALLSAATASSQLPAATVVSASWGGERHEREP